MNIKPFKEPIYVTRPLLPDLKEVQKKLQEVWKSQWLTNNGPQHQILEEKIKKFLKVSNVSLFNNGTIALITACQSLDLSGEVITTPFTFAATTHVLSWNKLKPIFCDIDPITMNIDADKIEKLITPKTSAILAVHVFGMPCDVEKIQKIADKYKLKVIYDAAHAFGVEVNGKGIGNYGDITMFSFHATKLFHTAEGGALTYGNLDLKNQIELLKNFGIKNEEEVLMPGINGKMNEIQASLGQVVLKYVDRERNIRKRIRGWYLKELKQIDGIEVLQEKAGVVNSYQYFVIRIDEAVFGISRNEIYKELKKYNIFSRKYFFPLCSQYVCYSHLPSAQAKKLPVANKVVEEVLVLPFYGKLKKEEVETICALLKSLKR